jgi:hypothetical protein
MSLSLVFQEPSGQSALYQREGRYHSLLEERFGQRFREYRRLWAERASRREAGLYPLSLDLALNGNCQLSCLMCPLSQRPRERKNGLLGERHFHSILSEARELSVPAMTLGLASEPLLHPKAVFMAAMAMKSGIMDLRLGTNGQLLSERLIGEILDSGLSRLEISLDAATARTYAQVRPGGDYEGLVRNIYRFLELREARSLDFPLLRLSFVSLPVNREELSEFMDMWAGTADMLSIQKPIWFPGTSLDKPERGRGSLCVQPFQRLGIFWDGNYWPCCSWYGEDLLGLKSPGTGIAKAWQSAPMKALRRGLSQEGRELCPWACQECQAMGAA